MEKDTNNITLSKAIESFESILKETEKNIDNFTEAEKRKIADSLKTTTDLFKTLVPEGVVLD